MESHSHRATTKISEPDPCHCLLEAEVPVEECRAAMQGVLRRLSRQAKVPGFRPGRVPETVLRRHFESAIREEAGDHLIQHVSMDALREKGIEPIGGGQVQDLAFTGEGPLRFRAIFEVRPRFDVAEYRGLRLTRSIRPVRDGDVDRFLEALREENFRLEPVEKSAVESGDYALVDFIEQPLREGEGPRVQENVYFQAGDERNFPVVNQTLLGMGTGEEREMRIHYPDEHPDSARAGREVHCRLRLKAIKKKILPDLDDEFARSVSGAENLTSLRDRIRRDLQESRDRESDRGLEDALLSALLERNPVPAPPSLVEAQARQNLRRLLESLIRQGIDPSRMQLDWGKEQERIAAGADRQVRATLLLDRICEKEGIQVTMEEFDSAVREMAEKEKIPYEKVRAGVEKSDGGEALRTSLKRRRILDFLLKAASISSVEETT